MILDSVYTTLFYIYMLLGMIIINVTIDRVYMVVG